MSGGSFPLCQEVSGNGGTPKSSKIRSFEEYWNWFWEYPILRTPHVLSMSVLVCPRVTSKCPSVCFSGNAPGNAVESFYQWGNPEFMGLFGVFHHKSSILRYPMVPSIFWKPPATGHSYLVQCSPALGNGDNSPFKIDRKVLHQRKKTRIHREIHYKWIFQWEHHLSIMTNSD
jgi:hypothetical protein